MNEQDADKSDALAGQQASLTPPVADRDHIRGAQGAIATLVAYGDYECPYTRKSMSVVGQLQRELGEDLRFVFRNFPLTEIHPYALRAAEAAEAADAQGRYWEMHDYLFAHQHSLEESDLLQYASDLGLDTARFARDLTTHAYMGRINGDVESGLLSDVQGTPTFFINGVLHNASWEHDTLAAAIQRAIEQSHT
jgi:protein-disulfide isomerase